mgnify:CR=1 FL=1
MSEPMDIAMRLLKLELKPPMTQGVEEQVPMQENIPTVDVDTMNGNDCCQKVKQAIVQHFEDIKKYPHNNSDDLDNQIKIIMNMSCEELQNQDYYSYWQEKVCSFNSDFQNVMTGEPMDIAMRLLKSPYDVYTHEGNKKEPFEGTLYAGGDVTDTPKYYTPSLEGALDYAVYGSATGDVPMRDTSPAIRTVQDPGFNEKGQPAGALIADPQLQDAYMQDDDSPLQSELMDDDTLRQLISQMSDKSPKSDTTGYYHSQQDREKHIQGALERLRNKTSGRLDLTDSEKEMGGISTRRHDELDVMDFDDINSGWDFLEDWEKSWLLNNRFDELPMWLQEEHQDEVKTGEPMDLAYDAIRKNLNRWFKEKWVDVSRKNKDGKHPPCGRSKAKKGSKGYPKCRPSVKVSSKTPKTSGSMSQGQKQAATKRKRAKKQGVGGKPTIVKGDSMSAFNNAWNFLKALPEQQMFVERTRRQSLDGSEDEDFAQDHLPEIDRYGARSMGTVPPAILGMLQR